MPRAFGRAQRPHVCMKSHCNSGRMEGRITIGKYNRGREILMYLRAATFIFLTGIIAWPAGKKSVGVARGENEDLIVTITLYSSPDDVKELLGNDLGGHFVVADVKVEPKYGKEVTVARDDFMLRDLETVEKSTPFAPSQIAGKAALVIKRAGHHDDDTSKKGSRRPTFSGIGIGGGGSSPGNDSGANRNVSAKMQNADDPKDAALEKLLNDKQLAEKSTDKPDSGLLYFAFEKVKLKDMQLDYGGKTNRIVMRFKENK
jgi:hypothetical protein